MPLPQMTSLRTFNHLSKEYHDSLTDFYSSFSSTGCKIKALRSKTNTYIKTPVRGEEPVFVVTGRRDDVAAAKRGILSAAEHFTQIRATRRSTPGGPSASSRAAAGGRHGETMMIGVRVPVWVVGLVVGPRGATIKRIQQDTQTYIVTPARDRDPVFEVVGSAEGVERARAEIEGYVETRIEKESSSGQRLRGHVILHQSLAQQQQQQLKRSGEKNLMACSHREQNLVDGSHFWRTTRNVLVLNSVMSGDRHLPKRRTQPDIRSPRPLPVTGSASARIFDATAHARSSPDVYDDCYKEADEEEAVEEEEEEKGKAETGSSRDVIVSDLNTWLAERRSSLHFPGTFPLLLTQQQRDLPTSGLLTSGSESANFDGFPVLEGLDAIGASLLPSVGAGLGGFLERCLLAQSCRSGAGCGPISPSSILLSPPPPLDPRVFRSLCFSSSRSPSSSPTESAGSSG